MLRGKHFRQLRGCQFLYKQVTWWILGNTVSIRGCSDIDLQGILEDVDSFRL